MNDSQQLWVTIDDYDEEYLSLQQKEDLYALTLLCKVCDYDYGFSAFLLFLYIDGLSFLWNYNHWTVTTVNVIEESGYL